MADTEKVMIPSLRFPDFDNEWKVQLLSELANFRNGKAHEQAISKNGDYVVINSKFISTEGKVRKFSDSQIAPVAAGEITMVMSDIPKGRALAKCYHVEANNVYTLNQRICALSATNSYGKFLFFRINRNRYFLEFDSGVGQTNLRKDEVLDCPLRCPETLPEQKKIADFLTSVDERIGQLIKKKALLEDYKKGVMQQLFSQQIRFKDDNGNDFPDWEEKKLGDIAQKKSSSITAGSLADMTGDYPVYGAAGEMSSIDTFAEDREFIGIVKDGAGVGRTMLCKPYTSVLGTMDIVKAKSGNHLRFIFGFLNLLNFKKHVTGSTIPHIYFKDYSRERIAVPTLDEQKKITDFLSAVDQKIESVSQQIAKTQTFKKGLLQQMFV